MAIQQFALPFRTPSAFTLTTKLSTADKTTCKVSFSRWESNPNGQVGFNPYNSYNDYDNDNDDDEDDEPLFGRKRKQRVWWHEDDEDEDDDELWFFKLFRAFGWMLPAIGVSLLLGTGPNAFLMALIPLGQTAVSLTFEKLWGSASSGPEIRRRTKRKPFVRSANGFRKEEKQHDVVVEDNGDYSSWEVVGASAKMGNQRGRKFGGWDELDRRVWTSKTNRKASKKVADLQLGLKMSGRRRRDSPLFVRLLIAVFPFLGSWTRFFF